MDLSHCKGFSTLDPRRQKKEEKVMRNLGIDRGGQDENIQQDIGDCDKKGPKQEWRTFVDALVVISKTKPR